MQALETKKPSFGKNVTFIDRESGIPLVGTVFIGILDRGSSLLQIRATTICNMSCTFCSTDAGVFSKFHKNHFIVEPNYLLDEIKKISEYKGFNLHYNIDSVGEPTSYPYLFELIKGLSEIQHTKISMQTNGSLLTKDFIDKLESSGLTRLNVSVHSLDSLKAKLLFGNQSYDIEKVKEALNYIKKTKIDLWITPVWIPRINDSDIVDLIKFAKENSFNIAIQKYETYRYSRKVKKAKKVTYWKFYKQLENWENEFGIKLKFRDEDPTILRRKSLPTAIDVNEKLQAVIVAKGWFEDQVLANARDRCVTIIDCNANLGDRINIKISENKSNIYIAELR